ncbi:unnamed protein product [Ceratitis capitata]|uniref:(Mediterranean fruit fly) hypothetical protein n=1 Tax=Ceratitis capitata TaxID=7213 RepID=A0A811UIG2_CERCA|nr:unnamed protein product [Ceratitis capitata]
MCGNIAIIRSTVALAAAVWMLLLPLVARIENYKRYPSLCLVCATITYSRGGTEEEILAMMSVSNKEFIDEPYENEGYGLKICTALKGCHVLSFASKPNSDPMDHPPPDDVTEWNRQNEAYDNNGTGTHL